MGTGSNDGTVKATGVVKAAGKVGATGSVSAFVINAGAGGAVAEMMLVWRAAMSRYSAWSANAAQRRGAVGQPRSKEREECASGRLAYAQCAQVGETEHVSQQEFSISTSTGHGPKLV